MSQVTHTQSDYLKEADQQHYLQVYKRLPLVLEKGSGACVWDQDGRKYVDVLAGIAVNTVGHCHPKVVKAIQDQAAKLIHISNLYVSQPQVALTQKLVQISGLDRVFFANSGAEANEAAIKLTRKYAHSHKRGGTIISFTNCFHGRTLGTIATGQAKYQKGFEPIPEGFIQSAFNNLDQLKKHLSEDIAGIMVEPIQGEGGIHVADQKFLEGLRQICDDHNIVLIFDEIQSGMGRTGTFFAYEHYGVKPDILTSAKALGGGVPIGAMMAKESISGAITYGEHGTTFGGNPLASAAALATIYAIEQEKMLDQAREKGEYLSSKLKEKAEKEDSVVEVRGKGLMIGMELNFPCKPLVGHLLERGILGNVTAEKVVRIVPPIPIDFDDIDWVVEELFASIKELKHESND